MLPEGLRMTLGTSINSHCFHRCFLSYTASMTSVVDKNKHHIHIIYISCKVLQRFDSGLVYKSESGETDSKKNIWNLKILQTQRPFCPEVYIRKAERTRLFGHTTPMQRQPCSPRFLEGVVDRWRVCKYG